MSKLATFGAGCFWGVEKSFKRKFPNLTTYVGYCGGADQNADYRKVCTGQTGHAEVIQVQGSFEYFDLVDFFFRMHDPTTANRQGNDAGSQYRSVIFYHDDHQKEIALNSIEKYQANFGGKIKTTVKNIPISSKEKIIIKIT